MGKATDSSLALRFEVQPQDAEAVRALVESTGFFRRDETDIAVELVMERLSKGDASEYFFVLADDVDGALVGYATYGPIACTLGSFDLYWIIVSPQWQGRGVGRLLLKEAERRAASMGGRRMYIETSSQPKYEPTRAFYEKSGYRLEARLEEFYAPGDDKLIYGRAIG